MLWAALATLIMNLTGFGDDTAFMKEFVKHLQEAVNSTVHDKQRRSLASTAIDDLERAFAKHRDRLATDSACIQKVDSTYAASFADYMQCDQGTDAIWSETIDAMIAAEQKLRTTLSDTEWSALSKKLAEEQK
jgi:hypothetical protein